MVMELMVKKVFVIKVRKDIYKLLMVMLRDILNVFFFLYMAMGLFVLIFFRVIFI